MIGAFIALAAACDPHATLTTAESELQRLDLTRAAATLEQLEAELGCGFADASLVFRLHAAEGILAALSERPEDAADSFVAARRLGPMPDMAAYGGAVAAAWIDAPEPTGTGVLALEPPPDRGLVVWVDGERSAPTAPVPAGLHVVQVGRSRAEIGFGRVVWVGEGDHAVLAVDLAPPPTAAVDPAAPRLGWTAAAGGEVAFGPAVALVVDGAARDQAATRVAGAIEAGLTLEGGPVWGRACAVLAPQLNGRLVYVSADGEPIAAGWAWGADVAGGARWGRLGLGVAAGARLPSRLSARVVAPVSMVGGFAVEPAVGVYAPTVGRAEPLAALTLRWNGG